MKTTNIYKIDREHVRRVILYQYGSLKEFYKKELGITKQRFFRIMSSSYRRKDNPAPERMRQKLGMSEQAFWGETFGDQHY